MTFAQFFGAVWNKKPFPWQIKLAEMAMRGEWPPIGLPTAAGKTALIDIAVFALAMGAPRSARRIFFVVDRRVIVDEAAARAEFLAEKLANADPSSDLGKLADALRNLGGGSEPLLTATLRGGIPRDTWTDSPLQPTVICSTVDQVGSSLLFRAYGSNEYGWPIRAGLAACDSLIILDEAHTSRPFAETLALIDRYRSWAERPLDHCFTVVDMSATLPNDDALKESAEDLEDIVLKARWTAEKRAKLVSEKPDAQERAAEGFTALIQGLVLEARRMRDQGARVIGVVVNRVMTARKVHEMLSADNGFDAILLIGRARPFDRDEIWRKWQPWIGLDRDREPERPIFVVATQCIEVGANIDFDALVTEIASLDALEQRFGRLDRNGKRGVTRASIVAQRDQIGARYEDPVYGSALAATWKWLEDHTIHEERVETLPAEGRKKPKTKKIKEEFVPMGVLALRRALASTANRAALVSPYEIAPVLMPAHLDLLCQTSPVPGLSPEPTMFLHGPQSGPLDVLVIWRQDLGANTNLWGDIAAMCPPSAAEAISVPVWAVRKWLSKRDTPELADIEGLRGEGSSEDHSDRHPVLLWQGPENTRILQNAGEIRPGMTIVVPAAYGGCDEWGWNPASEREVIDVGDPVKLRMGCPTLRLHPKLVERWNNNDLAKRFCDAGSVTEVRSILSGTPDAQTAAWVQDAVAALTKSRILKLLDHPDEDQSCWAAVIGKVAFDQGSYRASYTTEVRLALHLKGCEKWAESLARRLPEIVRKTVIRAAGLHDVGKADPRFQAWLRGGNPVRPDELLAKSRRSGPNRAALERARQVAGYPKGGRHELLSVKLIEDGGGTADYDGDLLLHLVASHHGRCRPFAPVIADDAPVQFCYEGRKTSTAHRLERAGSGVCERFWRLTRRYGWYGLAYLEAVVRLADHKESEAEENSAHVEMEAARA
jgi:CRISPR-associated endonuclease/helicase Cas3